MEGLALGASTSIYRHGRAHEQNRAGGAILAAGTPLVPPALNR